MGLKSPQNKLECIKQIAVDDFASVEEDLLSFLGIKSLPRRDTDQIIEGMITESDIDFDNKVIEQNYYYCSAHAILIVLKYIFPPDFIQELEFFDRNPQTKFFVNNYWEILKWILLDVSDLKNLYNCEINGDMRFEPNIRGRKIQTPSIHQVLRQGLFGSVSAHSFADKEISATIGTIRQLIELRIRRAFGLLAYQDTQKKNSLVPLNMSDIFNVIALFKDDIVFPLKFENIRRIYNWSNRFIHGGYGDYSWIPFFINLAFRDFIFGHTEENGNSSMYNGIATTQETIDLMQRILIEKMNDGQYHSGVRYRLLTCKPLECKIKTDFTAQKAKISTLSTQQIKKEIKEAWKKLSIFRTQDGCWVVCDEGNNLDEAIAFPNEESLLDWLENNSVSTSLNSVITPPS